MRNTLILWLPILIAGCVTEQNYQSGNNVNRSADMDFCMAEAAREAPQRLDHVGFDLNHETRTQYFNRCMVEKGYEVS